MSISRTVRIVVACALTVLGAFGAAGGAGVLHGSESGVRAMDTTWSQPVDAGASAVVPTDTTWSLPVDGGDPDGGVSIAPMDTTW